MRRQLCLVFAVLCFFVTVLMIFSTSNYTLKKLTEPSTTKKPYLGLNYIINYTIVNYKKDNSDDTKTILFYTKRWSAKNWDLSAEKIDKDSPELKNCPAKNCIFVSDRSYLKEIHEYDALIFHETQSCWYDKSDLKPIKTRSPHQLYIVAAQEYFDLSISRYFD
jgi:Fucosyltransferase, N-terminal